MSLHDGRADLSSPSPPFFVFDRQESRERSPSGGSFGSVSRHVQTQSWQSQALDPEEAAAENCPIPVATMLALQREEARTKSLASTPWPSRRSDESKWIDGADGDTTDRLTTAAAVANAAASTIGLGMNSEASSLSCGGADSRYVEVANERVFSALQLRSDGGTDAPGGVFPFAGFPRTELHSTMHAPQPSQLVPRRDGMASATLTPVRTSLTGTPTPTPLHTPLHSTAYGSNCYNRLLSSALLGGAEGRTNVFSFPARSSPPAKTQLVGSRTTPADRNAAASHGTGERRYSSVAAALAAAQAQYIPYAKESDDTDSALASLCSSPHPLTLGDSKEEDEDEDEETGSQDALAHTRRFGTRETQPQPPPLPLPPSRHNPGSKHPTPSVTSPVSYFQNAPLVWSSGNSPGLRLRFQEGDDGTGLFDNAEDTVHPANAWHGALTRPAPPMRTAGVVPNTCAFSSTSSGQAGGLKPDLSPDYPVAAAAAAAVTGAETTVLPVQCGTPLFAPNRPMHRMAEMVSGSCTPPSLRLSGVGDRPATPMTPTHADDVVPSSPLYRPDSSTRHLGFCTPLTSRPTFVLPSSTFRADPTAIQNGRAENEDAFADQNHRINGSCTTPVPASLDDSPTTTRSQQSAEERDVDTVRSTTTRSLFAAANTVNGTAARGRPLTSSHVLSTPVRHHDNAIRDVAAPSISSNNSSGRPTASPFPASPAARFPATPVGTMTPVSLSPARQTLRYGASAVADGLTHPSPYRDAFLGAGAVIATGHRRGNTSRHDAFHFVRAMTANATSTDPLHSPFYWGCFGVLVAQGAAVWCVGKGQPFRIFPDELDATAPVRVRDVAVTAVASTTVLPAATWEETEMADDAAALPATAAYPLQPDSSAAIPAGSAVATGSQDIVFLAVGTSAGDVNVYGYGRCSVTAPGAVAISPSSPQLFLQQPQPSTYAVRLQQYGTLKCADRIGGAAQPTSADAYTDSDGSSADGRCHAISVLRVVGQWLYIGDQSGHVTRYDLRHTLFLHRLHEVAANATLPLPPPPQQNAHLQSPKVTTRPSVDGASTPARVLASPNPRMPVHHFTRPSATPPTKAATNTAGPTVVAAAAAVSTPLPASSAFHFAVHAEEPVYNLEVTDNHSYVAVGTQTGLRVYRVAEMQRVVDNAATTASTSALRSASRTPYRVAAGTPLPDAAAPTARAVADVPVAPAAPLVVVRDAAQPVRCFAWMLCDYEALIPMRPNQNWRDDGSAGATMTDGEASEYDGVGEGLGPSAQMAGRSFTSSTTHTPPPSLVFATTREDTFNDGRATLKTEVQLYRMVTQSVVASCTLDYPVRVLKAIAGTTQIVVGTGSLAEWQRLASPSSWSAPATPATGAALPRQLLTSTPLPSADVVHTRSPSTATGNPPSALSPVFPRTSATAAAAAPLCFRRRSTPAVVAALRTLTGDELRRSSGLPHTPLLSATRVGSTSMRPNGSVSGGTPAAAAAVEASSAARRARTGTAGSGGEHGFLFRLEVCPCAADDAGCVCFRAKGEAVIGEGEGAVSGCVSPAQDQVSVLVQPSTGQPHHIAGGVANALAVKVKVWDLTAGGRGEPSASLVRHVSVPQVASFNSTTPTMESLR